VTEPSPLIIERAVKRFGDVVAVNGADLELGPSELMALVGPSGCGKSTLLRIIAGLSQLDSGRVTLRGELVDDGRTQVPPERRRVGLVFQEHALFPHLSVADNVAFGVRDVSGSERSKRTAEMLDLVSLSGFGNRFPHELSGGERQRVALARALAPRPALMLFDEPFASLDHNLRIHLRADVVGALRATQTPAVFVTHDQAEALAIGDRIAVMRAGAPQQIGTPAEIFHQPSNQFVAAFMGEATFLDIETTGNGCSTSLGPVPVDSDRATSKRAMVRPDDVVFEAQVNGLDEVVATEYRGSQWLLVVRISSGPEVLVSASHLQAPEIGDRGQLRLSAGHRQVPVER
jgi:iron(III) transport system ATP-binding protein